VLLVLFLFDISKTGDSLFQIYALESLKSLAIYFLNKVPKKLLVALVVSYLPVPLDSTSEKVAIEKKFYFSRFLSL